MFNSFVSRNIDVKRLFRRLISLCVFVWIIVGCHAEIIVDDSKTLYIEELFDSFEGTIIVEKTDIIATSGNNILKIVGGNLAMSYDLGNTWKYLPNTIGIISFVHWFKDQSCLICGRTKAYWVDSSFSEFHESTVYDYDGCVLKDSSPHFYYPLHGHEDNMSIAGKEVLIWPDYFGDTDGYISRIWFTEDNGKTIICICKNGTTRTDDGGLINCCHFHDCVVREGYDEIYITSGDRDEQCMLIRGEYSKDKWHYTLLGKGPLYKFDAVYIKGEHLYFLCDYTGYGKTGILSVPIIDAGDFTKYEYSYSCLENLPVVRSYQIGEYSFITYDGSVKGKMLFSYGSKPYRNLPVLFGNENNSIAFLTNPNNAGLVLIRKGSGYSINDLKLNDSMYDFTKGMRAAGFSDFGINTYK